MSDYTCKICGITVSKRQSLAYQGGRACKTHQEAQAVKFRDEEARLIINKFRAPLQLMRNCPDSTTALHSDVSLDHKEFLATSIVIGQLVAQREALESEIQEIRRNTQELKDETDLIADTFVTRERIR